MNYKKINLAISGLLIAAVASFFVPAQNGAFGQEKGSGRKIVVFKQDSNGKETKNKVITKHGAVKIKELDLINGVVVNIPSSAVESAIAAEGAVERIDDDVTVEALGIADKEGVSQTKTKGLSVSQVLPWGIDRIDAEMVWSATASNTADPIKVAVIDTGISLSHPDLAANIKGGYNAISPTRNANDDNGHGSHVAGIIGAVNNTVGVVGAAPSADLYAVKVLNRRGSGYLSDVIEGIQWAANNGMNVANMSLGTTADIQSMHDAVIAAYNAGLLLVAAAGNDGGAVNFPAAYPEVVAVSATDSSNIIASWSSRGPEVDLAAPGVSVYSTYKGSNYATMSGTSMATPHVTGAAALVLNTAIPASYDLDADGKWDPSETMQKLWDSAAKATAGHDNLYGWGLVNAYNAIQ